MSGKVCNARLLQQHSVAKFIVSEWGFSWFGQGEGTQPPSLLSPPGAELEFLKRLWGLGTEEEEGHRTGPLGYMGWRNSFRGIDSGAPYTFKSTSSGSVRLCNAMETKLPHTPSLPHPAS